MRLEVDIPVTLALLKRPEVICILAIVLILSGRKYFRDFQRGFGRGVFEFRDAIDDEAREAGRAAGANFGKPALDALTQDNEAVEFRAFSALRPINFRQWKRPKGLLRRLWSRLRTYLLKRL